MVRIELDNDVFEGENAVYLLGHDQAGPTTLIDAGAAIPQVEDRLRSGLAAHGVGVADLDQLLLTHHHGDHAGLAGPIQAESGATVRVHPADAPLVERSEADIAAYEDTLRDRYEAWGMPAEKREELEAFFAAGSAWPDHTPDVEPLTDGDRVPVGEGHLEVVHLPGHAAGLVGFWDEVDGDRVLYTGDAVLPEYTPNVGGADVRVADPLATYAETLVDVVAADPDRALPGHRQPIADPAGRAREILGHHRERTARVVTALREHGPADAWTVSARLFGDLSSIHILHGPGEAAAHLDHLERAGAVERDGRTYALVDETVDPADLLPTPGA